MNDLDFMAEIFARLQIVTAEYRAAREVWLAKKAKLYALETSIKALAAKAGIPRSRWHEALARASSAPSPAPPRAPEEE